jgi:signal transduction histidine kinase
MDKEKIIWQAIIFGSALLIALGGVIISFILLYQKKKYLHGQEVMQLQENFTKEMLHSKNEIQEQTLQHIASEIHDNFNPTLSVINLNLAGVIPAIEEPVKGTVIDTKLLVKQLMAELRGLSVSLNTDQISRIGFPRALERYVEHLGKAGLYTITFNKTGDDYRLPVNKEIILLRMCQEILNNIVKHANAKNIYIDMAYDPRLYKVTIRDDGDGFDPATISINPQKQDSSGLNNLQRRALAIDAKLSVTSQATQGTTIVIEIAQ